jgi:hypothetical protein
MPCVLWYTNVIVYKLLFLCFVLCDIPMKWFTNYYFYALRFVIYQWNGSQVVIFMPCVLWYTNGMVYKLLFLCFVFCDIPMEWFASCLFMLCILWYTNENGSQNIISMLYVLWYTSRMVRKLLFLCFVSCDVSKKICKWLFLCFSICDIPMEWSAHYITIPLLI